MGRGEIVDQTIDLFGGHSFTNIFCNVVQQSCVDLCTFTDTFNLFRCAQYLAWRKFVTLFSVFLYFIFYFIRIIGRSKPDSFDKFFILLS